MIIGVHAFAPLEINSIGQGLNGPDGEYNEEIRYKVVREATRIEYEECCKEFNCIPVWDNLVDMYLYYEVQTD